MKNLDILAEMHPRQLKPKSDPPWWIVIAVLIAILLLCPLLARAETASERQIIAEVIAAEAGGEGERGMAAVANVIANRARQQHKTPYQIVTAKNQFYGLTAKNRHKLYLQVKRTADRLAADIMSLPDITGGAVNYENIRRFGLPKWAKKMRQTVEIKNHVFYK